MERHKTRLVSSTPLRSGLSNIFDEVKEPSEIGSPPAKANMKKQSVLDMVIEAINAIAVPKKGASYQAIKKWITVNKEADPQLLKSRLKVAVIKGINNGILLRPRHSETAAGATGCFMLAETKPLKSSQKTNKTNKKTSPTKPIANKKISPTKAGSITSKKATSSSQDKKMGTKTSKKSPKKAESEKNPATKTKVEAEKKPAAKAQSNAETKKQTAAKAPSNAERKPAAKAPSNAERKPAAKAPSKVEAEMKPAAEVPSKAKAGKKPAVEAPPKAKAEKKPATKAPSKAEKKPAAEAPSKAKAEKKLAAEAPSKATAEKKTATKAPSKALNLSDENIPKPTENFVFSDSPSEEDSENEEVIPEAPKQGKVNALAKNKTMKNHAVKSKVEDAPAIKDKKGKVVKEAKKLPKIESSNNQTNEGRNVTKTIFNKKLYASEDEFERQDLSDPEITIKKKRIKVLKSCSSDTELEVSKRNEKNIKKVLRTRKNVSKV